MVREELINSAVSFLQDPSVATSPLDQRKAFLQSKNLTQEEVDVALARAGESSSTQQNTASSGQSSYRYSEPPRQAPPGYGYGYAPYPGQWQQSAPEPPRRDWRDWFIMATVTGGVSYGLYTVAKRYVMPLISPPTPPQLEQDKAAIDAEFSRAFALIDQLATDTAALKNAEAERTEKLDSTLGEVEAVIDELKAANKRREDEARRLGDEVRGLRDMIPKALDGWKSEGDSRLKELGSEMRSLKMLVGNRVGGGGGGSSQPTNTNVPRKPGNNYETFSSRSGTSTPTNHLSGNSATSMESNEKLDDGPAVAPGVTAPKRDTSSPFRFDGKPAARAIPAWQLAAAKKTKDGSSDPDGLDGEGSVRGPKEEVSAAS